jgi:uncharacterized protein
MSFGTGPLLDRDAGRGMEVRLGMTKSDATGAQSLEEILAQIKKSVAGEAGPATTGGAGSADREASGRPVDGGLSARLAGVLKDAGSAARGDDDHAELPAAHDKAQGPGAADPAKLTEPRRRAADPLWFLRQPAGTTPQDGTPSQTPPETGAAVKDGDIKLSRPQDLRASLPPLFGAEDQPSPLARMPVSETQPSPPQTSPPGKMAGPALDNIHTAKTQPLMPAPDMAGESPAGASPPGPKPESDVEAVTPAGAASAEPAQEAPPTVEAKLDDDFQPQAQAASMAMAAPLAEPADVKSTSSGAGLQARTLEQVIGELLEPVIRQWLEANLPRLVEEIVRKEVARAIAVERPTSVV